MGLSSNGSFDDVNNNSFVTGTLSVGTSQVEIKVGGSKLAGRQEIVVSNNSNATVYYGPTGVTISTGMPIVKGQIFFDNIGEASAVYLIAGSAANTVVIQEKS